MEKLKHEGEGVEKAQSRKEGSSNQHLITNLYGRWGLECAGVAINKQHGHCRWWRTVQVGDYCTQGNEAR
jgi:hypothetical protein